jgi:hypothetical protein
MSNTDLDSRREASDGDCVDDCSLYVEITANDMHQGGDIQHATATSTSSSKGNTINED